MKEIKLRALDKKSNKIYEVEAIDFLGRFVLVKGLIANGGQLNFEDIEKMQYTGLKDKNGKEIYEGDILHIEIHNHMKPDDVIASANEVVEYRGCKYGVLLGYHRGFISLDSFCNATFEVIGNIYENPELLGGEAND